MPNCTKSQTDLKGRTTVAKARLKTKAVAYVSQSRDDVARDIRTIGDLQRDMARESATMNDAIAAITAKHQPTIDAIKANIEVLQEGVHGWCEAHRADLTEGGKSKTANFITGTVQWRNDPPSVTVRNGDKVLEMLTALGLSYYIRTKKEIKKEAILADRTARQRRSRQAPEAAGRADPHDQGGRRAVRDYAAGSGDRVMPTIHLKGPGLNNWFAEQLVRDKGPEGARERTSGNMREAVEHVIAQQQCDRAFQIADEAMFELLSSHCIGIHEPGESLIPVDEDSKEVELVDLACSAIVDAVEWLKPRGYVDVVVGPDGSEVILVLRRPV